MREDHTDAYLAALAVKRRPQHILIHRNRTGIIQIWAAAGIPKQKMERNRELEQQPSKRVNFAEVSLMLATIHQERIQRLALQEVWN